MNDQTPFSRRGEGPKGISKWSLVGIGPEAELGRMERYCAEMNSRDPYRRMWFVGTMEDGRRFVDCRDRKTGEFGAPRQITGNPIIDRDDQ